MVGRIPISHSLHRWLGHSAPSSTVEQLLLPSTQAGDDTCYALENFLMGDSGILSSGRRDYEGVVNYLGITADQLHPYMMSVFPTGNDISQENSISCQKARIVLKGFEEHKNEFQLISWPPNSMNLNVIEHLCVLKERQLRDQSSSWWNILTPA
ncbi:DDE_3 domain-containing protein [Trichonephila clavipes]|nr:DDE_3 domain-containing protein [Trichonephila clavipes]